jgi:hypothetical protein
MPHGPESRKGNAHMTAAVIRFPPRRGRAVWLVPARDGGGWLVLLGANGWIFGSRLDALKDAAWLACSTGLRRIVICTNGGRA